MAISDLVQVGTGLYVNPHEVVRIYPCKGHVSYTTGECSPDTVGICIEEPDSGLGLFGTSTLRRGYHFSDWSIEQVEMALGLTSVEMVTQAMGAADEHAPSDHQQP